jgi:protein-S-isoprenylcysteine O-methyltransferase Ste14
MVDHALGISATLSSRRSDTLGWARVAVILGQAVLFADWNLLGYGALIWLFFHIVVIAYEEPTLRQSFGAEYESYCANVPRWLPRLTPRAV